MSVIVCFPFSKENHVFLKTIGMVHSVETCETVTNKIWASTFDVFITNHNNMANYSLCNISVTDNSVRIIGVIVIFINNCTGNI